MARNGEEDDGDAAKIGASAYSLDICNPAKASHESLEMPTEERVDSEHNKPDLSGKSMDKIYASAGQFHLLYWLAAVAPPELHETTSSRSTQDKQKSPQEGTTRDQDSFEVDTSRLNNLLSEMQIALQSECLEKNTRHVQSKKLPPQRSLKEVQKKLKAISRSPTQRIINEGHAVPEGKESIRDRSEAIVRMATWLFEFLLPLESLSDMGSTYWGYIYWYLEVGFALTCINPAVS